MSNDQKWIKLEKRIPVFHFIPFVDFVLVAGSMALGTAKLESDFDVIVGARYGRIFTVRFLAVLLFGALGWRANHKNNNVADKICLNHFVTSKSYCLAPLETERALTGRAPPYNEYWRNLYKNLIPIYGGKQAIEKFFLDNAGWVGGVGARDYSRLNSGKSFNSNHKNLIPRVLSISTFVNSTMEFLLNRKFGDFIELLLKKLQIWKIKKSIRAGLGYKPRIRYCDEELEFHPDTKRTEFELTSI